MIRQDIRARRLAMTLSSLAGFVDAVGFISAGGFFVSFMSGNTTRLAVSLFDSARGWITAGSLIAAFVLGVTLAARMRRAGAHHGPLHVLLAVAALLSAAALLGLNGWVWPAALCMAVAMGAENIVFERDGEVVVGVTYMTGALVKLGQRIADALGGGPRWAWTAYLQLWLGLACGAILGAFLFHQIGFHALWLPVTVALICGWMLRGEG